MNNLSVQKKLYSALILMVVSVSLMITVSFAWFTLSTAPAVNNIKVVIGGDNTIKIASNIQETVDGVTVNYPGGFTKVSNFTVDSAALLSPVSTADGVNWFVLKDELKTSQKEVNSLDDFILDTSYSYANTASGGYIYVDFWVLSSLENCVLRLSSGDVSGAETGSYVVQLPSAIKSFTNKTGYELDDSHKTLSSSIRVGFLVNDDTIEDNSVMHSYMNSSSYDENFKALRGIYDQLHDYDFMIYEPNGTSHSNEGQSVVLGDKGLEYVSCEDGEYHVTYPIGIDNSGNREFVNVTDRLVVQTESKWKTDGNSTMIDDLYQGYLLSNEPNKSLDNFYNKYLKGTYLPYVKSGFMFSNTWNLYFAGDSMRVKSKEVLSKLDTSNVVKASSIVRLKKNVPQRVRMFVWIEGQDIDCNYYAADQNIALRLELAGSSGQ